MELTNRKLQRTGVLLDSKVERRNDDPPPEGRSSVVLSDARRSKPPENRAQGYLSGSWPVQSG